MPASWLCQKGGREPAALALCLLLLPGWPGIAEEPAAALDQAVEGTWEDTVRGEEALPWPLARQLQPRRACSTVGSLSPVPRALLPAPNWSLSGGKTGMSYPGFV